MKVEIAHGLGRTEAVRRMKALTEYWRAKYGVEASWAATEATLSGTVLGKAVHATIAVDGDAVSAEAPDPGILLRRTVTAYVTGKVEDYLRTASRESTAPPTAAE